MTTFIDDVVEDLLKQPFDISQTTIVLPSKRAGTFFVRSLAKQLNETIFAPDIISIEEFIERVSGFRTINNAELLFEFYDIYLEQTPASEVEPFETFSKWAQIILQDFNEIDRYLIPPTSIFDYLNAIKKIENQHWSLDEDPTDYIKNYLAFWNRLKNYYKGLTSRLAASKKGYQGMVYRQAANSILEFIAAEPQTRYVFAGFNALNTSEETLIKALLKQGNSHIYWDIDTSFLEDKTHDAGLFIRAHKQQWSYFDHHEFKWLSRHYATSKNIHCVGTPKNVGQVKYVGQLLDHLVQQQVSLDRTAVVLSDESLLIPLLNSLPPALKSVNITMGLPLHNIPLAAVFDKLFKLHINYQSKLHHKDLIDIVNDPFVRVLFTPQSIHNIAAHISHNNRVYITVKELQELKPVNADIINTLFGDWNNSSAMSLERFQELIFKLKAAYQGQEHIPYLELEYLHRFHGIFNELIVMNQKFDHVATISTQYSLYKELLKSETLDFQGEPLKGLQIMGMLETRLLDFDRVIITSVNEGILPAGKSNNSFIPFDVKVENALPTFKEKDAVYTYHFYRLLQRAKDISIIYNTEPDVLGGAEKSRFITQLEVEGLHEINSTIVAPLVPPTKQTLKTIKKNDDVLETLKAVAIKGFSPSSLTSYIRNPLDFYQKKILGIKEFEDVEESVAANTLGTVLHNTLEDFYKPLQGHELRLNALEDMISQIDKTVSKHFKNEFRDGDISRGKNLIVFEIAKRYIYNFIASEIRLLKDGHTIKIIAIEVENNVGLKIDGLDFDIKLTGKVDRVDEFDGVQRIIDYKSGSVIPSQVKIDDWALITTDYTKYSKSFQLLMYAYMMHRSSNIVLPVEAGIISFKKLGQGLLKFEDKTNTSASSISQETLEQFEAVLKSLVIELFDPSIDFEEKEV